MGTTLITPNGDTVKNDCFRADTDGIYQIGLSVAHTFHNYSGPFQFTIFVNKYAPTPSTFSGKWLLVKEVNTAFGARSEIAYSPSKALSLIEFRNDSLTEYRFGTYNDSVYHTTNLFAGTWKSNAEYNMSENKLTFHSGNDYGSYSEVYEKYTGSVNDLMWANKNCKAPAEFIGTWYLSYEKRKWRESWNEDGIIGEETEDFREKKYNSGAESGVIYTITSDSVTIYSRGRDWTLEIGTYPAGEFVPFFDQSTVKGSRFTSEECDAYIWTNDYGLQEFEIHKEIRTFSEYAGPLPPAEWNEVPLPSDYTDMQTGHEYSGTLHADDSLWFRIPVLTGRNYHFTVTSGNFDTYLSMISQEKTLQGSDDNSGDDLLSRLEFTADLDGFHYVLLTGISTSTEEDFTVAYSERSTSSASSPSKSPNAPQPKDLATKPVRR
ncbi:MAG: lipocalin family protein [Fibrobacterota bacterium]